MSANDDSDKRRKRGEALAEAILSLTGLSRAPKAPDAHDVESEKELEASAEERRPWNSSSIPGAHRFGHH